YVRGASPALVYDDGFRRWSYTYDHVRAAAEAWATHLRGNGLQAGDRLLVWSDNCPEWVAAFWGSAVCGVVVIPVDRAASPDLVARIIQAARPLGLLIGDDIDLPSGALSLPVWRIRDVRWPQPGATSVAGDRAPAFVRAHVDPDAVAEIVFTSGT